MSLIGDLIIEHGPWTEADAAALLTLRAHQGRAGCELNALRDELIRLRAEVERLRDQLVTPDPNAACAAHDDAHLGRPCPGDDWDPMPAGPNAIDPERAERD